MTLPATADDNTTQNNTETVKKTLPPLKGKQRLWLRNYLNQNDPKTFFNATASAKCSNYQGKDDNSMATIGKINLQKLTPYVDRWLDEHALSDTSLKCKIVDLMQAKETKFFQKDGKVTDQREVEAIEVQRKTLDMALKVKGLYKDDGLSGMRPIFNVAFMSVSPGLALPGIQAPIIDVTPTESEDDFSDI